MAYVYRHWSFIVFLDIIQTKVSYTVEKDSEGMTAVMKISQFQTKDIVNLSDGKKLGVLHDLEIELSTGQIEAIIVSESGKWMNMFQREPEIIIPWHKIKKVGEDLIFVDYKSQKDYDYPIEK